MYALRAGVMPATTAHAGGFIDPQESNAASARRFREFWIRAFFIQISPMFGVEHNLAVGQRSD